MEGAMAWLLAKAARILKGIEIKFSWRKAGILTQHSWGGERMQDQ